MFKVQSLKLAGGGTDWASRCFFTRNKAAEDCRTPRRYREELARSILRQVLDCGSPLPLLPRRSHTFRDNFPILLLSLFCFLPRLDAQELPPAEGPEAGRELAAHLMSMQPTEEIKWRGTLKVSGHNHKTISVPVLCETRPGATNWSVMYLAAATPVAGSEKLTVVFSTNGPNQYIYARAAASGAPLDPPKTLTGAEADIALAGSDFWLSDLGFEFYHWPDQVRLRGQMRSSRPCYVLQSNNPHPAAGGYARVVTWVDKESGQPLQADAYGADQKKFKEFELGSVAKVNGYYQVKNLKMLNLKTGTRTSLEFDLQSQ